MLENLKEAIRMEGAQIDRALLERMEANFQEYLQKCINENGHHKKDIVFQICQLLIPWKHSNVKKFFLQPK